ncbi:MAG: AAA domain-containing protein [Bacteroidota bacterium]
MQNILKSFLKRLTNLTSHNKSLLLLRLVGEQFFDLHELNFLLNKPSFDLIAQLIAQKTTIPLCEVQDSRYEKVNEISRKLRKLARTERFIEEERGAKDLYVGYPFVRGKLVDGTLVNAPLLFFPVTLQLQANQWTLQRRDEPVNLNRSFLLAYAHFNQISLSDDLLEKNLDELVTGADAKDSLAFRTQLYELLKASPLEIHFNQESFTDQLQHFTPFKKEELEKSQRNGELKLFPEAVLGLFPQAGSYLVPDYEFLIEDFSAVASLPEAEGSYAEADELAFFPSSSPDLSGLDTTIEAKGLDGLFQRLEMAPQPVKEAHTFTAFLMDASQEHALKAVKRGSSMVIQGPPGTGKSQLICNLITDFTARGKRVLVVCQKRAALDVVFERLKQVDMTDFVALLHDFQNDRKGLYTQIDAQLEKIEDYKAQNHSLDAIFLERTFAQESRKIERLADELQDFRNALFDEEECGLSVKELYLTSHLSQPSISLKKEYKKFSFLTINDFVQKLRAFASYSFHLEREGYLWKERVSFRSFQLSDLAAMEEAIQDVPNVAANLAEKTAAMIGKALTVGEAIHILKEENKVAEFVETVENAIQWDILQHLLQEKYAKVLDSKWLEELEKKILKCLKNPVENTLPTAELSSFERMLKEALQARKSFFSWLYWQLTSKDKATLMRVATANELTLSAIDLKELADRTETRIRLEKQLQEARRHLYLPEDQALTDVEQYQTLFHDHRQAVKAHKRLEKTTFLSDNRAMVIRNGWMDFSQFTFRFMALLTTVPVHMQQWKPYLTNRQVDRILSQPSHAEALISVLREDFDLLGEADRTKDSFTHGETEVADKLLSVSIQSGVAIASADRLADSMIGLFQNSLRLAWIEHIEERYPILRAVSSFKLRQTERELQESIRQKQALSKEILLLQLREQTYKGLEFNRLNNATTYRELKHQVTKKRKIWPVRKLMGELSAEVFNLVPCWMASPESVSAIFPIESSQHEPLFDLVIFDEASQCFSENGLPAIYRARQVVITGDSKQLNPSDLYRVRFDAEDEEEAALEIDSLLDLTAQYLPQSQLKGHYRSKSLDLIGFSNQHFYQDTLQMLPDFKEMNKREPAIQYLKVEGIWENNANKVEAERVVSLVVELTKSQPDKQVGVVTFNFKQQNLIQDLLELRALEKGFTMPPSLFVKNIENVQGDERDIIVFSIGYAPDLKGKLALQFGSLNALNGENRLNVAVTRARERVYVISSLMPSQLHTEETRHEGPKLLKKYLEYAWQVSSGLYKPQPKPTKQYRPDWLLKDKLSAAYPQFRKELPFADLTIKDDDVYQALLLTDDDLYYQSLSPKEAHAYMPFALQAKNWQFKRMYSREYWKGKAKSTE